MIIMKKRNKWTRPHHRIVRNVLNATLGVYARLKYGAKIIPLKEKCERQYLVLYNHQTGFDQFFVGMVFKKPLYYVASEDIFSMGILSKIIKGLVAPIPIKKQTTDPRAIINCVKVAREGGSIAIAPEGNRTYSGTLANIKPTIAQLAKHLRLPIAFVKIEGGFGVQPRWSDAIRRGEMAVGISNILEYEDFGQMSDDALAELIEKELSVVEAPTKKRYRHKKRAEFIERAIYVCPRCGLSTLRSKGARISCTKCSLSAEYGEDLELRFDGDYSPFRYLSEWYEYQCSYINSSDFSSFTDEQLYEDTAGLYEVILYKNKKRLCKNAKVSLFGDRIEIRTDVDILSLPFSELRAASVLGKNKLNLYHGTKVYQLKGDKRFSALKYVNVFYRYTNLAKGAKNVEFLGL